MRLQSRIHGGYAYAGVSMASQLEVRWAQLMVALGVLSVETVKSSYEFVRVKLGNGILLTPDFYLAEPTVFFEVKGDPTISDWDRMLAIEEGSGIPVYVGIGTIPKAHKFPEERWIIRRPTNNIRYTWTICPQCGSAYIAPEPMASGLASESGGCWSCGHCDHEQVWTHMIQGHRTSATFRMAQAWEIASAWQSAWERH